MSSEKRKILSSTNQDSAEKQEICKTEEKQISDKEVENIPKKEQTLQTVSRPHLPLYIKSYSETRIEPTILDHTWKIYQFMHFSTITNTTTLPSIPEIVAWKLDLTKGNKRNRLLAVATSVRERINLVIPSSGRCWNISLRSTSLEKRKSLRSTDQDSAEKRKRIMEENKISDKKEVENISTENTLEKEQTVSLPSLRYIKSWSETQIKSNIFDHTWKINQFMCLINTMKTLMSPPFPEPDQYVIQMEVISQYSLYSSIPVSNVVYFYILTSNTFNALCTTTVMTPSGEVVSSKSILGPISNNTLLIKIEKNLDKFLSYRDTLTVHCKFQIFHNLINKTIRMNSLPSSTEFSEDVTYFKDSTFDESLSKNKSISW
ncbi:uncharacterized protein [Temnothorax nylanderi]|uniref:uncharacterized protein isoform X2 n=1 Tax=Temnothorax nylanderi TaxID=102681 RepID=UPI003A8AD426